MTSIGGGTTGQGKGGGQDAENNERPYLHHSLLFNLHIHEADCNAPLLCLGAGIETLGYHTSHDISTRPNKHTKRHITNLVITT